MTIPSLDGEEDNPNNEDGDWDRELINFDRYFY
jgi:hypothetical protein